VADPVAPAKFDATVPHHARVYDYVLGGKDYFAADREAAESLLAVAPDARVHAKAQRGFLVRVVRFLAESGIRQFVDLGTGIPTSPNVHEVARSVDHSACVVYVDFDAMVVAHSRGRVATDDRVIALQGDIRRPERILADADLQALVHFEEPVGVLFLNVLHDISNEYDPAGIVVQFRERMAPGSYVAVAQFADDSQPSAKAALEAAYADTPWPITFRPRDQILRFFDGFELVPPGLVDVERWRPEADAPATALKAAGGVGRKP
jgi:S-adenosyl methyltransferase